MDLKVKKKTSHNYLERKKYVCKYSPINNNNNTRHTTQKIATDFSFWPIEK